MFLGGYYYPNPKDLNRRVEFHNDDTSREPLTCVETLYRAASDEQMEKALSDLINKSIDLIATLRSSLDLLGADLKQDLAEPLRNLEKGWKHLAHLICTSGPAPASTVASGPWSGFLLEPRNSTPREMVRYFGKMLGEIEGQALFLFDEEFNRLLAEPIRRIKCLLLKKSVELDRRLGGAA